MKVATVLIVKDEENNLKRLLESMSPEVIGNLFVTDTGSSDDTVAVAESYGAAISTFPWCKNFAAARNYAAEQVTESYDWIFMPDADEYFLPGEFAKFVELLEAQPENVIQARIEFYHFSNERIFPRDRCIRRGTHRWRKRVHEVPEALVPGLIVDIPVHLYHAPGEGWAARKAERDLELLLLDFKENPHDLRNTFYLAREFYYQNLWPAAIGMFEHFLSLQGGWSAERAQAHIYMAELHNRHGDSVKASESRLRACEEAPWRREGYYTIGLGHYGAADSGKEPWENCIPWLEAACAVDKPVNDYLSDQSLYQHLPHTLLTVAYSHIGEREKARHHATIAYAKSPENEIVQGNMMWVLPGISRADRTDINTPEYWNWSFTELSYWKVYPEREASRFEAIARMLHGRVLDIGSGPGVLKEHYTGGDVITLDYANAVRPDILAAAEKLPVADNSFDTVVIAELLEHLENPVGILMEARRVLKPRGKIVATVPMLKERDTNEHLWLYSGHGLKNLLSLVGQAEPVGVIEVGDTGEHILLGSVTIEDSNIDSYGVAPHRRK